MLKWKRLIQNDIIKRLKRRHMKEPKVKYYINVGKWLGNYELLNKYTEVTILHSNRDRSFIRAKGFITAEWVPRSFISVREVKPEEK